MVPTMQGRPTVVWGVLARSSSSFLRRLARFAWLQAMCLVFPAAVFATLALSTVLPLGPLPRYDFILLCCVAIQAAMVATRLESKGELFVICVFHLLGLGMELFKTHVGSWVYPEFAYSKVSVDGFGSVPLYSGFMYASVASYLCQSWRRFDLRLEGAPAPWGQWALAAGIYANFFTKHVLPDLRWVLAALVVVLYRRTWLSGGLEGEGRRYRLPLAVTFVLLGLLVWLAENIATFFGAWVYPNQRAGWQAVDVTKISSWGLLVIVSFIVVAGLKHYKQRRSPLR